MSSIGLSFDEKAMQKEAQTMYDLFFRMKILPPGRGLWAMGSPLTEERHLYAALNNCAFVSTVPQEHIPLEEPWAFLMDASMLGVGVGFDTKGAGQMAVHSPLPSNEDSHYVIPDSREGWVESVRHILRAYLYPGKHLPTFDYSLIRPAGALIRGFGGVSQGPEILEDLHVSLHEVLSNLLTTSSSTPTLTSRSIVDMMNLIGKCVVAGNVRRTAEIAFGDPNDQEYIDLKNYEVNPERASFGWTSNNSIFAEIGMDYREACERVASNGEPGFAWLENMRKYGRMCEPPNYKDHRAMGGNPCLEQTLESYELCCLVEIFPNKHESLEDFLHSLHFATLYGKIVSLGPTPWHLSNKVMMRNRRLGISMSGLAQFVGDKAGNDWDEVRRWCEEGYQTVKKADRLVSEELAVRESIKVTSIKPSGSVSLLNGSTSGLHYPISNHYIRRVQVSKNDSKLIQSLEKKGLPMEDSVYDKNGMVVSFPIEIEGSVQTMETVSMTDQLDICAFFQRYWADNQVSCTVTFDPEVESAKSIASALDTFQHKLKGISFLPAQDHNYAQIPYERISKEEYDAMKAAIDAKASEHAPASENMEEETINQPLPPSIDSPSRTSSSSSSSSTHRMNPFSFYNSPKEQKGQETSTDGQNGTHTMVSEEEVDVCRELFCDGDKCEVQFVESKK
jgi:adenosylcobalamin-dependent ribonucleoside-triphosphate reductase